MKSKGEVLQTVKLFSKDIGVPETIICDAAGDKTSNGIQKFCRDNGTILRVLEEGTPWVNKSKLYIGLINEAVIKYTKESD